MMQAEKFKRMTNYPMHQRGQRGAKKLPKMEELASSSSLRPRKRKSPYQLAILQQLESLKDSHILGQFQADRQIGGHSASLLLTTQLDPEDYQQQVEKKLRETDLDNRHHPSKVP